VAVPLSQAAYFASSEKLCFVVTEDGERILLDTPLADLEQDLDPGSFFRANRRCIVSAKAVKGFRAAGKGRLALMLSPDPRGEVMVSQERAPRFREWLAS
jgi:DNA-binding LytR/AlgR family response regulator